MLIWYILIDQPNENVRPSPGYDRPRYNATPLCPTLPTIVINLRKLQ
jgi:hypothetical protein